MQDNITPLPALPDGLQLAVDLINAYSWSCNEENEDEPDEAEKAIREEHAARIKAERTLVAAGYTDGGGELWRPPIGPNASPLLDRIDSQAQRIAKLERTLAMVERWANHHGVKPSVTPAEALQVIQHHPAIREITAGYADGVMPDTPNPYARIAELEMRNAELEQDVLDSSDALGHLSRDLESSAAERDELRARLTKLEQQEPVAWQSRYIGGDGSWGPCSQDWHDTVLGDQKEWPDSEVRKVFARPVPTPDGEPLTCDVCGAECRDPWHYSSGDKRHMHACDTCWPVIKAAPEAAR